VRSDIPIVRRDPPTTSLRPIRDGAFGGDVGYPSAVTLSADERDLLARTEEVTIETASASGAVHRAIIWVVVDGEDVFLRSANGDGARWYREAIARPEIVLEVATTRLPARVEGATDPGSVERCSAALTAKYHTDPSLPTMLRPETLPTTLRVLAGE
jgi:hypothetical protein